MLLEAGVDIYSVSKLLGHSDVRITQKVARSRVVGRIQRDSHAGGSEDLLSVQDEWCLQVRGNALRHRDRFVHPDKVLEQDRELIATESGDHISRADTCLQPLRDGQRVSVYSRQTEDAVAVSPAEQETASVTSVFRRPTL